MNHHYNKAPAVLGILAGLLAVVLAAVLFFGADSDGNLSSMDTGTYTSYSYYGGDAYTGMQQASADAARNVRSLSKIVVAGFEGLMNVRHLAALLLVLGLGLIAMSWHWLAQDSTRATYEAEVMHQLKATQQQWEALLDKQGTLTAEVQAVQLIIKEAETDKPVEAAFTEETVTEGPVEDTL